jgi:hypothetical protein
VKKNFMKLDKIVAINCLIIIAVISMWLVDIGEIGMSNHFLLTNNFWTLNPGIIYHMGMYFNVICLFIITIFTNLKSRFDISG